MCHVGRDGLPKRVLWLFVMNNACRLTYIHHWYCTAYLVQLVCLKRRFLLQLIHHRGRTDEAFHQFMGVFITSDHWKLFWHSFALTFIFHRKLNRVANRLNNLGGMCGLINGLAFPLIRHRITFLFSVLFHNFLVLSLQGLNALLLNFGNSQTLLIFLQSVEQYRDVVVELIYDFLFSANLGESEPEYSNNVIATLIYGLL